MKKFLTVISILSLVFCSISGLSEGIDLKSMSDEELIELGLAVREEMFARDEYTDAVLYPGQYIVGDDIEPGKYIVKLLKTLQNSKYCFIKVYENMDACDKSESIDHEGLSENDECYLGLKDGYIVVVDDGILTYVMR